MKAERILIVGLNWIGDAVMSMPALQACRAELPDAHITLLVKPYLKPLWQMHAVPDDILCLDKTRSTIAMLRAGKFDRACILPNSFRSAFLPAMAGIPQRIGLRGELRRWILTRALKPAGGHQSNEYFPILAPASLDGPHDRPQLTIPDAAGQSLAAKVTRLENCITLMPGAARGASKMWPLEHFEALGKALLSKLECPIVLAGGSGDAPACEALAESLGSRALSLAGKTGLQEWAALLGRSRVAVANDSGGMHLAAAVGTPVVGIYGMTDPEKTGPLGERCKVIQNSAVRNRDIARDSEEARQALESIAPETVLDAVLGIMD
jgi:heptosyltransferase-2